MVFQEEGAVQKVLDTTPHTIDGRQVDTKKAIPHAIHQVSSKVTLHAHTLRHHPHAFTHSHCNCSTHRRDFDYHSCLNQSSHPHISHPHVSHPHISHPLTQALKNRTKKIFVGGVPTSMPEETIRDYFVQFGEVRGEGGGGKVLLNKGEGNDGRREGGVM